MGYESATIPIPLISYSQGRSSDYITPFPAVWDAASDAYSRIFCTPPTELYHHTTLDGALGIVSTKSLWATDPQYLNDHAELRIVCSAFDRVISRLPTALTSTALVKDLLGRLRSYDSFHLGNDFVVTCFCSDRDLLSQWRAYGGQDRPAYSLGFRSDQLTDMRALHTSHNYAPRLGRIVYDPAEQEDLVERVLRAVVSDMEAGASVLSSAQLEVRSRDAASLFISAMSYLAVLFKHFSFEQEKEWRLVLTLPTFLGNGRVTYFGSPPFRPTTFGLAFYQALQLAPDRLPLSSITQGPTGYPELAASGMERFVGQQTGQHVGVHKTDTPYRN